MRILIVLNQIDNDLPVLDYDFLIGVDGGCSWCLDKNQVVDLAIGDFDSLDSQYLDQLSSMSANIERHPVDKDQTDLELALQAAMKKNPTLITVYGVWGGRIDHSLANLLCLAMQTGQTPVVMPGKSESGYLIKNMQKISISADTGDRVSILALGSECRGVSNTGLEFPLTNATISQGTGVGLSNRVTESESEISLESGVLLILTGSKTSIRISQEN